MPDVARRLRRLRSRLPTRTKLFERRFDRILRFREIAKVQSGERVAEDRAARGAVAPFSRFPGRRTRERVRNLTFPRRKLPSRVGPEGEVERLKLPDLTRVYIYVYVYLRTYE